MIYFRCWQSVTFTLQIYVIPTLSHATTSSPILAGATKLDRGLSVIVPVKVWYLSRQSLLIVSITKDFSVKDQLCG